MDLYQPLYVAPGGGLTSTRPTATTDRVQNIAGLDLAPLFVLIGLQALRILIAG